MKGKNSLQTPPEEKWSNHAVLPEQCETLEPGGLPGTQEAIHNGKYARTEEESVKTHDTKADSGERTRYTTPVPEAVSASAAGTDSPDRSPGRREEAAPLGRPRWPE